METLLPFSLATVILLLAGGVTFSAEVPQQQEESRILINKLCFLPTKDPANHHSTEESLEARNRPQSASTFADCSVLYPLLYWTNAVQDGFFPVKPESNTDHFDVFCDMTTDGGGWTVIQKRFEGRVNFNRNWADYKNGFGRVEGEHWLGLDKIYNLTIQNSYELYVQLEDWEGNFAYARYETFNIGDESKDYTLTIGAYSGDAGDSLDYYGGLGMKFSTTDVDNDGSSNTQCAQWLSGGWWYGSCSNAVLNGPYFQLDDYHGSNTGYGMWWYHWKGTYYSLKATKMMVRPLNYIRHL
ncbi:fibrinogen-like protein 1 [Branchiostoma floridae]|uniref:Fibrinogen-like protein 1 n=1 Tax=Branchiostoma floridae TaxID=7739 RepID=A0A9J7NC67_BRAFL|nr:fibrinogen-like protein 1 [Branchiostoma floridae]